MITVSPGLKAEIQKLRGRRLQARVRIDYSDVNIDNTVQATASSTAPNTYLEQIYNGKEDVTHKWASLDGSWVLGEYRLAPVTASERARYEIGWWSEKLSNANAEFLYTTGALYGEGHLYGEIVYGELSTNEELVVTFTERTISNIRISFDNARGEYARDFDVCLYAKDGTELYCVSIANNTGLKYSAEIPSQNLVASIVIKIKKWSDAYRQAKIAEAFTSVFDIYDSDDIISLSVAENREISDISPIGSTASGKCSVTLYDRDRVFDYDNTSSKLYNLVRQNVRITPQIGNGSEWIPLGTYYAKAWDISKQSITATVTGVDRMALLGESQYEESAIIDAPDDETYTITSDADFNAGTRENVASFSNSLRLAYV